VDAASKHTTWSCGLSSFMTALGPVALQRPTTYARPATAATSRRSATGCQPYRILPRSPPHDGLGRA
jgi:hypothetical protein